MEEPKCAKHKTKSEGKSAQLMQQSLKHIFKDKQTPEKTQRDSPLKMKNHEKDPSANNF